MTLPCVVSVPHSATRTLKEHLGVEGRHYHFNIVPNGNSWPFKDYTDSPELVHVAVRNPMDVAASWAVREGHPLSNLINSYAGMFEYLAIADPMIYKMEDLPRLAGNDDKKGLLEHTPWEHLVLPFQDLVMAQVVEPNRAFFESMYEL